MGEGRRDRNSDRHRPSLRIEKSSSDTEVARSKNKSRKSKSKIKGARPFRDFVTVDELGRYRRRRVQNHPKDTLGVYEASDARENLSTEYRRAFRSTSEESIVKNLENPSARQSDEIENPKIVKDPEPIVAAEVRPVAQGLPPDERTIMETTVERSRHEEIPVSGTRRRLIRRGTSLKREGNEFYVDTESSSYAPHQGQHKAELARRPTSLKMEGDMDMKTEQCEKFIEWLSVTRPEMVHLPSHLKLEGDLETTTENHAQYVPFVGARRPELLRQIAHLQLEGDFNFLPEYTDVFREHAVCEKRMPVFPESHLKTGGQLGDINGTCHTYSESMYKDSVTNDPEDQESRQMTNRETEKRPDKEEDILSLVSKSEVAKCPPLEVPEYKDAYKDFPRERPKLMRPEDMIGRADGSKVHQTTGHTQFQTKIDQDPEYNSKFFDAERLVYRKPPLSLRPSAATSGFERRNSSEFQRDEATSEVRSQYVPYGHLSRVETLKMPANLCLEGSIEMQPEYQAAYCKRKENSMINEPRIHRYRNRSVSASRNQDNTWMTNNNGEHFGQINAAEEQDAFQVLSTRVHDDSIVGKPPPGIKRGSRSSEWQAPTLHRPTNLDTAASSPVSTHRSTSPSYRLHVRNVDEEPRCFDNRRQSPSRQIHERVRSPSPRHTHHHQDATQRMHHQDATQRSYSPSFGRTLHKNTGEGQHAFVVLDNPRNDYSLFNRAGGSRSRKVIERNCIATEPLRRHPKNCTPTNWMPPWYDNTNTLS